MERENNNYENRAAAERYYNAAIANELQKAKNKQNIKNIARNLTRMNANAAYAFLKNNSGSTLTRLNAFLHGPNVTNDINREKLMNVIKRIADEEIPQEVSGGKRKTRRGRKTRRSHKRRGHTRRH